MFYPVIVGKNGRFLISISASNAESERLLDTAYDSSTPINMGIIWLVCPMISKMIIAMLSVLVTPPATDAAPTIA